ncbi:molybdate ABC transporter substrate-binding protein [Paraglaciecola sp. L3A3]|uniref:molybdate ABC transporter substrate-binding protein n=1 Tax=Paraglaciecola sp. L3A3 TaxID=2686358 RepID=UPI00131EBB56|nr:molybdate ABC transporter substrate-binding protein [Paraglaciecola sp. L3A3]
MFLKIIPAFIFLFIISFDINAEKVHIAVASNFTQTMKVLVKEFETNSEHTVSLSFASSGKLYAQIKHGAPFDVFFSADSDKPLLLEKEGLIVTGSRFTYALGQLILWSNKHDKLLNIKQKLMQGNFTKLAIANPRLAPYGLAAQQTIENLGLTEQTLPKWVQGENIMQTLHFISSGNAELGFVALSQLKDPKALSEFSIWLVPAALYQPIRQDLVWLNRAKHNPAADEFMQFIHSAKASSIIATSGYKIAKDSQLDTDL